MKFGRPIYIIKTSNLAALCILNLAALYILNLAALYIKFGRHIYIKFDRPIYTKFGHHMSTNLATKFGRPIYHYSVNVACIHVKIFFTKLTIYAH